MTFNTYWSAALLIRCQEARRNAPPGYLFGRCRILAQKPDFNLFGLTIFLSSVYKTLNELDDTDPESNASQKFLSLLDTEILFQETSQRPRYPHAPAASKQLDQCRPPKVAEKCSTSRRTPVQEILFRRPDGGCPLKNKKGVHIAAPMKSGMTRLTNLASSAHCREKAHRGRAIQTALEHRTAISQREA